MPFFQSKVRTTGRALRPCCAAVALVFALPGCTSNAVKAEAAGQEAQQLMDVGDLPGARAAIARALTLRGDDIQLLLIDGRVKYRMNDWEQAFNSYNLALSIDPLNQEALQAVSQIGAAIGAETESVAAADRILSTDPKNLQAMLVKGMQMLNRRDHAGALALADRMLAVQPNGEGGLALKARALTMSGKEAEALALLDNALKASGPNRMLATAMLETARDRSDVPLMLAQFRTLSDLVPRNVDLALDQANVRYKIGQPDAARALGWTLVSDPATTEAAVRRLVDLWIEYDKTPLAPDRVAALAQDGSPAARLAVARFYLGIGAYDNAKALVGSMLGFEPAGLRLNIGYAQDEPGTRPGTVAEAEALLRQDTTNCDALNVRANDALAHGRAEDAITAAQQAIAECPDRDNAPLLARAYAMRGNVAGVRRAFLDGIGARPLSTAAAAAYVGWLLKAGQPSVAVDIARGLTQRAPAKVSAWQLLKATCPRAADSECSAQAGSGLAAARRNFAIDLPPGARRPNPLLGNRWQ